MHRIRQALLIFAVVFIACEVVELGIVSIGRVANPAGDGSASGVKVSVHLEAFNRWLSDVHEWSKPREGIGAWRWLSLVPSPSAEGGVLRSVALAGEKFMYRYKKHLLLGAAVYFGVLLGHLVMGSLRLTAFPPFVVPKQAAISAEEVSGDR